MLPAEADILLVTESSSEEDSETDDQSYFPPEVYPQTWQGYITHVMHVVLHCLVFTSYMDCHLLTCLLYKSYISIISCHHVYIVHTHHLSELWHGNPFNKDIIQLYHVILFTQSHILNYVFPSFLVSHHNVKLCHAILFSQPSYM